MNKQAALEWLAKHLHQCPSNFGDRAQSPNGYYWVFFHGKAMCISEGAPDMEVITKEQWEAQRQLNNKGATNETI